MRPHQVANRVHGRPPAVQEHQLAQILACLIRRCQQIPQTLIESLSLQVDGQDIFEDIEVRIETGEDPRDPLSLPKDGRSFLESARSGWLPRRVAWSRDLGTTPVDPEVAEICEAAARRFTDAASRERLIARLRPGATIGMDGVYAMQDYYAKGGFVFSHRNVRFRDDLRGGADRAPGDAGEITPLSEVALDRVLAYDRTCFPAPRPTFIRGWTEQPTALALGCQRQGKLCGYGVIRRCGEGHKVGPLFADDLQAAEALYARLVRFAPGGPIYLDAPENNPAAIELARRHRMTEVFGCARMYLGPPPDVAHERVFGVTTFELG